MKIKSIEVRNFKKFEDLKINELPPAKLVVLAGPNGSGKSSLFDAFSTWQQYHHSGHSWDSSYHSRSGGEWSDQVLVSFHSGKPSRKSFYFRSAHRNDPDFQISTLSRQASAVDEIRIRRMVDSDGAVSGNYQRLASNALEDAFALSDESKTLREFRSDVIGEISAAVNRLFPDLQLQTLGNPLQEGTFKFSKGTTSNFSYKNLSAGEKAAFDLILDLIVKKKSFNDTVFIIDEPETHLNTRLQGPLLTELYDLIPDNSQLWISTHSIGMMREAQKLYKKYPGQVIFLDFEGHDFDKTAVLKPVIPNRAFWERVLQVALSDLAELVSPKQIVICEGNPKVPTPGKNEEHDARIYGMIFEDEFPDTRFISGGNSLDVAADRLKFATVFPNVVKGVEVLRLIDRDDHSPQDQIDFKKEGIHTLSRRHLECYLYDLEILHALCDSVSKPLEFPKIEAARAQALQLAVTRGRPSDDMKAAAPQIYVDIKRILNLTAVGNDALSFARNKLAPLVKPGTSVYEELKSEIFGA
jgi:predicted ATPase